MRAMSDGEAERFSRCMCVSYLSFSYDWKAVRSREPHPPWAPERVSLLQTNVTSGLTAILSRHEGGKGLRDQRLAAEARAGHGLTHPYSTHRQPIGEVLSLEP
jgi:hypothetical protein